MADVNIQSGTEDTPRVVPYRDAGEKPSAPNVFAAPWGDMPVRTGWTAMGKPVNESQGAKPAPLKDADVGEVASVADGVPAPGGSLAKTTFDAKDNKLNSIKQPTFKADKTKPDGGAINWLGKLFGGGRRAGETEDEYDERVTRNREKLLALGDAIRHMGNIYQTTRYGRSQQFNSPITMMEQGLATRKAERQKRAAAEADAAYKVEKMRQQAAAAEATANYRAAVLGYKDAAEKRAAAKMKADADHWQQNYDRGVANDKFNQDMAAKRLAELMRHNKVAEGQGAARVAIAHAREGRMADGGGSGGGSLTNLSTPTGHTNRKKDLSTIEKRQLRDYLMKNGYINANNKAAYDNAISEQERGAIINNWIAYAANAPGRRGDAFRRHLEDHFGYRETVTTPNTRAAINMTD